MSPDKTVRSDTVIAIETARELVEYPDDVSEDAFVIVVGLVYLANAIKSPFNRLAGTLDGFLTEDIEEEDIPF